MTDASPLPSKTLRQSGGIWTGHSGTTFGDNVDVNLRAPIALSRLVLPHMRTAGSGFIVNIASLAGKLPLDGAATYSATKFTSGPRKSFVRALIV